MDTKRFITILSEIHSWVGTTFYGEEKELNEWDTLVIGYMKEVEATK